MWAQVRQKIGWMIQTRTTWCPPGSMPEDICRQGRSARHPSEELLWLAVHPASMHIQACQPSRETALASVVCHISSPGCRGWQHTAQ